MTELNVQYDVSLNNYNEDPYIKVLREFIISDHHNFKISFDDKRLAEKKRISMRYWLNKNEIYDVTLSVRGSSLYAYKEEKEN